jgi:hypothetical protein
MLNFLIDNLFVLCGGRMLQHLICIKIGMCVLLTDLFPHFYKADLIDLVKMKERHLARSFNLTFRYIDVVLSLNNPRFGDHLLVCETKFCGIIEQSLIYIDLTIHCIQNFENLT